MNKVPTAADILAQAEQLVSQEGIQAEQISSTDKLQNLIIPALANSRNIQSSLTGWYPPQGKDVVRRIKTFVLLRFKNIVVNVLEKTIMRQQKYNELTFQAIVELQKELAEIKQSRPQ